MKQILGLAMMGLVMLLTAGCVSPAVITPTPTLTPTLTPTPTPYVASPIVSYYPTPVTNVTAYYNVTGSVIGNNGVALNGYTVALTSYGVGGVADQFLGMTDANGSYRISFSSPKGYYNSFNITVISPSKQLVYQDKGTRTFTGNETAADIML